MIITSFQLYKVNFSNALLLSAAKVCSAQSFPSDQNLGRERPPREEQPTNTIQIKKADSHPWLSIINVSDPCGRSCMLQAGALMLQESRVQD